MIRRSAVTLIEVLVSIFIMGVGLLALLTLFPLGALTMDQAIKADRAAALARNMYGIVTAKNVRRDTAFFDLTQTPVVDAYTDPNPPPTGGLRWIPIPRQPGLWRGPTYPIFVDPWGVLASGAPRPLGATPASPGIPRRSVSFVAGQATAPARRQQALTFFSLTDDMQFTDNGTPQAIGTEVQRTSRYTSALLLRRVIAPERDWIEMAVVVYYDRPLDVPGIEPTYPGVVFDPASNAVLVEWDPATQQRPPIRKGGWVLDATVVNGTQPEPHGYFYRVTSVTDAPPPRPGRQAVLLELQDRPRQATTNGVLVVMEYAIEVFDEGLGWKP